MDEEEAEEDDDNQSHNLDKRRKPSKMSYLANYIPILSIFINVVVGKQKQE